MSRGALAVLVLMLGVVRSYVRETAITDDKRPILLLTQFGCNAGGRLGLHLRSLRVADQPYSERLGVVGFYVYIAESDRSEYFSRYHGPCPLVHREPAPVAEVFKRNVTSLPSMWVVDCALPGFYHVFFVNCLDTPVSMEVRFAPTLPSLCPSSISSSITALAPMFHTYRQVSSCCPNCMWC